MYIVFLRISVYLFIYLCMYVLRMYEFIYICMYNQKSTLYIPSLFRQHILSSNQRLPGRDGSLSDKAAYYTILNINTYMCCVFLFYKKSILFIYFLRILIL